MTSSDDVSDLSRKIFNQRKYLLNLHASNPDARPAPVISDIRQEGKYSGQNIKSRDESKLMDYSTFNIKMINK